MLTYIITKQIAGCVANSLIGFIAKELIRANKTGGYEGGKTDTRELAMVAT